MLFTRGRCVDCFVEEMGVSTLEEAMQVVATYDPVDRLEIMRQNLTPIDELERELQRLRKKREFFIKQVKRIDEGIESVPK